MKTAIIYLRVSTDEQAESGLGLAAQLKTCRAWCKSKGYEVGPVHRDEGLSGSVPVDRRPGLTAALGDLRRGSVLVASRRDRYARDLYVAAVLEETCRRLGAQVETPDAPADDGPFGTAMRGMMDVFAQLERALIAARTRAALAQKRARGEKTGGSVPFGWSVAEDGKQLVPNPAEQRVVRRILKWTDEGVTRADIIVRLDKARTPHRGSRWHRTTIARIVERARGGTHGEG